MRPKQRLPPMLSKYDLMLGQTLVTALCVSVALGANPACSAIAIAILLAFRVADKYFATTVWDLRSTKLVSDIADLQSELAKVKQKQGQAELKGALGGIRSG